ncbi:hypothetical protein E2C01_031640 [Portunus trituberculatus]|uniref:Uncharacterized protein n=1 Tax=Portunus trituberculatus TaxID=210409 RepID=A0A5B7EY82_PORTR|nr:hypothetical protein [Portunus trituberculatus]
MMRKAVSLSVRISSGAPRSQKTASNCSMMLSLVCSLSGRQMAKREGPQSMSVRYDLPLSIPIRCQMPSTDKLPLLHFTGAGSID